MRKLNVLLAITEQLAGQWAKNVEDFIRFFKANQGDFKGVKKTFVPKPEMQDDPSKRQYVKVVTTVEEKLKWMEENNVAYFAAVFAQEKTNASGNAKAQLVVDGANWGEFTSLELLRLKSLVENGNLHTLYQSIPVRADSEEWAATTSEEYEGKEVFEGPKQTGVARSIEKESYILPDPNIVHLKEGTPYTPQVGIKNHTVEVADYTIQHFSGEYSHRERAEILKRRSKLLVAITEALKTANEVAAVDSALTAPMIFNYLHRGAQPGTQGVPANA